jgi:hypothetical protein
MKIHSIDARRRWPVPVCAALFTAALLASGTRAEQVNDLDIGVRADLDKPLELKAPSGELSAAALAGGKIFVMTPPQLAPSVEKLVKPVDADAMLAQLYQVLERNDFRAAKPNETPEIVITLHYGRGYLRNPYFGLGYGSQNAMNSSAPTVSIILPTMDNVLGLGTGTEAKRQKSEYEKLFLLVSAWDYAKAKGGKPQRLWKTLIYVDDPDHRDLGSVFKKMLAAGGPYFGRKIKKEEEEISTALPEGHVKLGPTTVIDDKKPAPK